MSVHMPEWMSGPPSYWYETTQQGTQGTEAAQAAAGAAKPVRKLEGHVSKGILQLPPCMKTN